MVDKTPRKTSKNATENSASRVEQPLGQEKGPIKPSSPAKVTKTIVQSTPLTIDPTLPAEKRDSGQPVAAKPRLLSGGNPQIAKAAGDKPVQAYIDAMPGWKSDLGRRLDAIIVRTVPRVCKAVKWNTPLYGNEGEGWFVAYHCMTKYVKVTFFRGAQMSPVPPNESKQKEVRYFHIYENDELDESQFASWVKQASALPGEKL